MAEEKQDRFSLPALPFNKDALKDKGISQETIEYHYGKHHAGYVRKLNAADKEGKVPEGTLEDLIKKADGKIFNLAAQIWNHTFYWESMSADGGSCEETLNVAKKLKEDFGSVDEFLNQFKARAGAHFGSGWIWLSSNAEKKLVITDGHDAFNPLKDGLTPILTIDVWEHAYYVDQRNDRGKYIGNFVSLINWKKVEERFNALK
mmetsp:Transcript_6030/g.9576  ORF Transcript_6030/g.9576 Transcript_6030/m.9576 type:complete len:204 (+) Transcript_6030:106-717(+)